MADTTENTTVTLTKLSAMLESAPEVLAEIEALPSKASDGTVLERQARAVSVQLKTLMEQGLVLKKLSA